MKQSQAPNFITSNEPITHVATTDLADMLDPIPGRRMALPGFDPEFVDFPDYIIRITHWIWHNIPGSDGEAAPRDVELCRRYYAEDCLIHTQAGDIHGVQAVVDGTNSHLQTFPDRILDADNVIWSDDGVQGRPLEHDRPPDLLLLPPHHLQDDPYGRYGIRPRHGPPRQGSHHRRLRLPRQRHL